jgi:HEAT repeat protein
MGDRGDQLDGQLQELGSSNGMTRMRAREELVKAGMEAAPRLRPLLNSPETRLRWEALKALAVIGDPGSLDAFRTFLDDPDSDIRWLAASGLIKLGDVSVRPVLQALSDPKAPRGRLEMGRRVLNELAGGDPQLSAQLAPLMEVINGTDQAVIAERAARALSDVDRTSGRTPDSAV